MVPCDWWRRLLLIALHTAMPFLGRLLCAVATIYTYIGLLGSCGDGERTAGSYGRLTQSLGL